METNNFYIYNNDFKIENAIKEDNFLKIGGYAAHWNKENLNGEVVDSNSFKSFFELYNSGKLRPSLNYNHTSQLIGGIDTVEGKENGLYINAHLNRDVALVRDMLEPCILAGDIDSFSTEGYILNGYDGVVELPNGGYYVKDFILRAVAVVSNPADHQAKFTLANYLQTLKPTEPENPYVTKWWLF